MTSLAPSVRLPFQELPALVRLLICVLYWSASCAMAESSTTGSGSVPLTQEELSWLADHPVIRLAPDPDFPPIEFIDEAGRYSGISADYVALI